MRGLARGDRLLDIEIHIRFNRDTPQGLFVLSVFNVIFAIALWGLDGLTSVCIIILLGF